MVRPIHAPRGKQRDLRHKERSMRRALLALGVAAVALTVLLPGASGRTQDTPGVTARTITLGGTFPLSGPASSYAPIPVGMAMYFSWVNAHKGPDGKRGV